MKETVKNIGFTPLESNTQTVGVGYVCIPADLDRDTYIYNCYDSNKVSILVEESSIINNVFVDDSKLQKIVFPDSYNSLGSVVVYVTEPLRSNCFIVGILSKEPSHLKEHLFNISKKYFNNLVDITGDAEHGYLNLTVRSKSNSNININVLSKNQDANFKLTVNGKTRIYTNEFDLRSQGNISLKSLSNQDIDEYSELILSSNETRLSSERVIINDGDERSVLGDTFINFLSDFIDELSNITVTTSIGQMPIMNKIKVLKFKEQLQDLLSKTLFIE